MPDAARNRLVFTNSGAGDLVILLHPIGLGARFWDPVVTALAGRVQSCAVDLAGHGDSQAGVTPPSIESMAADLAVMLRQEDLGPAIVVGCSLGGMVAQALAAAAPDLVRGLILANTNFTQTEAGTKAMRDRAALARTGMEQVVEPWLERWFSPQIRAEQPDEVARIVALLKAADAESHAQCWEAIGNLDLTDAVSKITVPSLVVAGDDDRSIPLEKSQALAARLAQADLRVFDGAGHLTPSEQPDRFAELIVTFAQALNTKTTEMEKAT